MYLYTLVCTRTLPVCTVLYSSIYAYVNFISSINSTFARRFGARFGSGPGAREASAVPAASRPARALRRRGGPHAVRAPRAVAQLGGAAPRALAGARRRRHRPHPVRLPALPEPTTIRYAFTFTFAFAFTFTDELLNALVPLRYLFQCITITPHRWTLE